MKKSWRSRRLHAVLIRVRVDIKACYWALSTAFHSQKLIPARPCSLFSSHSTRFLIVLSIMMRDSFDILGGFHFFRCRVSFIAKLEPPKASCARTPHNLQLTRPVCGVFCPCLGFIPIRGILGNLTFLNSHMNITDATLQLSIYHRSYNLQLGISLV